MKNWLKDNWPFILLGVFIAYVISSIVLSWWASYQCVTAGFLGGTIHHFRVVCFVLLR